MQASGREMFLLAAFLRSGGGGAIPNSVVGIYAVKALGCGEQEVGQCPNNQNARSYLGGDSFTAGRAMRENIDT